MGVLGMRLKYELEGKSVLDLEPTPKKRALLLPEVFLNKLRSLIYYDVATFAAQCREITQAKNHVAT
jgi:DNA polymerase V